MKANAPIRKIFNDAVDMLTDTVVADTANGISLLSIKDIKPFHNHPFHLYEDERLEDMVASVREHGVLNPVIVLRTDDGYEMLSGHNRANAAKLAGLTEIPAIIKSDLSEEEAYIYVIETNLMQRSFSDLAISEKAAVLAERYNKILYQRNREDIIRELSILEGKEENGGHGDHLMKNRDSLGNEYGLSGSSVARLLRVNEVIPKIKELLDKGDMALLVAVQLSYTTEDVQKAIIATGKKITKEMAIRLREDGVRASDVEEIVCGKTAERKKQEKSIKISVGIYDKYFKGKDAKTASEVIEKGVNHFSYGFSLKCFRLSTSCRHP